MALPDPVIHLYWAYALARAEEMFKVTRFPPGVCGVQAEREYVILHPKKSRARFAGIRSALSVLSNRRSCRFRVNKRALVPCVIFCIPALSARCWVGAYLQ